MTTIDKPQLIEKFSFKSNTTKTVDKIYVRTHATILDLEFCKVCDSYPKSTWDSIEGNKLIEGTIHKVGGRSARLVRPFEKNLNLTIIGLTKTLKIQGYDHELQDFWSDQGRCGRTCSAGPDSTIDFLKTIKDLFCNWPFKMIDCQHFWFSVPDSGVSQNMWTV